MTLIEKSLQIALTAHMGQTDKAGETYILHPLRLMGKMTTDYERATALLHDVIEDSDYTADRLAEEGIPAEVVKAVLALTKRRGDSYEDFISRAKDNALARTVKKADLEDNINVLRLKEIVEADFRRLQKYLKAWQSITNTIST